MWFHFHFDDPASSLVRRRLLMAVILFELERKTITRERERERIKEIKIRRRDKIFHLSNIKMKSQAVLRSYRSAMPWQSLLHWFLSSGSERTSATILAP
jgi:hypothetical protein